ncbi:transglycosylase domain-containing protein [Actinacidiphila sp. ITFR-21]|uniref:transglycosylase domain-containing protein n=1 Tax=Actinacidiphila sp. ITFR-21 TaxID=3075199 RepID=UPI0028890A7B|nr:transglycosylase domain-containing protein [Streptomyces sp. ITFR-21]WNI16595.1 transglycosylase domain-containing protein [Streptomyces sp. ITFR-21]
MSEHRRKLPQSTPPPGGGRAAARRGGQQPAPPPSGGRRAAGGPGPNGQVSPGPAPDGRPDPAGGYPGREEQPYQGRAAARRAAQGRGGSRRKAGPGGGPGGPGGPGGRGGRGPGRRPAKKHFIDYPRFGKEGWRHWVPSWRQVTAVVIGSVGALIGLVGIAYAMVGVPDVNLAAKAQNNVYFWDNGDQMIATGGEVNRQIIGIDAIPKGMQNAVISAENKTFETDKGVDPMGIGRALFNMARGGETQGGSTITQQYVKNTRLNQEQTFTRKFKELFISIKVGATMKKSEIMAGYLNTSYFGRGAYGIQAAARTYYGVDADKLNPSQCALLAALLKGPTYFDPAGNPGIDPSATAANNQHRSEERWSWILDQEVKDGRLPAAERATYTKYPTPLPLKTDAQMAGQIGYLVDLAKSYLINNNVLTADQLAQGGYEIHTTFQKPKVDALEAAVKKVQAANIKPGGSHKNSKGEDADKFVQFGGASVNPKDGAILAIYGGTDFTQHFTNNADETGAQVGSTFKPFVLAAAMTHGIRDPKLPPVQSDDERTQVSPDSWFSGKDNQLINDYTGKPWIGYDKNNQPFQWHQPNDDGDNFPRVTLRTALDKSLNSPYVQLGQDVGTDKVHDAAIAAGLVANSNNGLLDYKNSVTYSIGTSSPSAIRMADAYATFDNHGEQNDPYSVKYLVHQGEQTWKHQTKTKIAFPAQVADTITGMLTDVIKKGTGTTAQLPGGRPAAGKTGTTDDNKSAWFDGFTPQLSTSIVMFRRDDQVHTDKRTGKTLTNPFQSMYGTAGELTIHGNSFPAQIWKDYMGTVLQGQPKLSFDEPSGKVGEVIYGNVPSPTPSPTATTPPPTTPPPTTTPPMTTPPSPTWTPPTQPTPSDTPTQPCFPWNDGCNATTTPPADPTETPSSTPSTAPGRGPGNPGG